jgi:hypothetical protein
MLRALFLGSWLPYRKVLLVDKESRKPGNERYRMALEHEDLTERIIGAAAAISVDSFCRLFSCVPAFLIERAFGR